MKQHPKLSRITVTLPPELVEQLQGLRDAHRVSASSIVELALSAYLENVCGDLRRDGASLRRRRDRVRNVYAPAAAEH